MQDFSVRRGFLIDKPVVNGECRLGLVRKLDFGWRPKVDAVALTGATVEILDLDKPAR